MKKHNLLVTCAGGKKAYSENLSIDREFFNVIGADMEWLEGAIPSVDVALTCPPVNSPKYKDWLDSVIDGYGIDFIQFKIDKESQFFTNFYEDYKDLIIISDAPAIERLSDKLQLSETLERYGLGQYAVRTTAKLEEIEYPAIIKPRRGTGSTGVVLAHSEQDIPKGIGLVSQDYIQGVHWTVDVIYDPVGKTRKVVPYRIMSKYKQSIIECRVEFDGRVIRAMENVLDTLPYTFKGQMNLDVVEVQDFDKGQTSFKIIDWNVRKGATSRFLQELGFSYYSVVHNWIVDGEGSAKVPIECFEWDSLNGKVITNFEVPQVTL